jgi:O-antigen/teichoic acid export membrane protein
MGAARRISVNTLSAIVSRAASVCVLFWVNWYLLRNVSPEEYALWPLILSLIVFAPLVTTVVTASLARSVARAYAQADAGAVGQVVRSIYPFVLLVVAVTLAIGGALAAVVEHVVTISPGNQSEAKLMLLLLLGGHAIDTLLLPFAVGLFAKERFVVLSIIGVVQDLIRAALIVGLVVFVDARVLWVVVATVGATLVGTVARAIGSRICAPELRLRGGRFSAALAKEMIAFGGWSTIGFLAARLQAAATPLMLNELSTTVDVAAHNVALIADRQMEGMYGAAIAPVQFGLVAMHANADYSGIKRRYLSGSRYSLWAALLVALPLVAFAESITRLYAGDAYMIAAPTMCAIYLAFAFKYSSGLLYSLVFATGQLRNFMLMAVATQVASVLLTFAFVGYGNLGAFGAGLSTFTTALLAQVAIWWPYACRLTHCSRAEFSRYVLLPGTLPFLVCVPLVVIVSSHYPVSTLGQLLVAAGVATVLYLAITCAVVMADARLKDHLYLRTAVVTVAAFFARRRRSTCRG